MSWFQSTPQVIAEVVRVDSVLRASTTVRFSI